MQLRKNRFVCLARGVLLDNGVDSPWLELNLGLLPREKGAVLTIPSVVYTLDSFAVEFMSLCVDNPIFNEFKTI